MSTIIQPPNSSAAISTAESSALMANRAKAASLRQEAIAKIILSCPAAGEGVNRWLFTASLGLRELEMEPEEIEELLEDATADCGRDLKPDEIARAVRNSASGNRREGPWRRSWPQRNYEQIEAIGLKGTRLADLERLSPVKFDPVESGTEAVIDVLFPGNPLVCAGASTYSCLTRPREEWRGFLDLQQFIVPSPMSKRKGRTKDRNPSSRNLEDYPGEHAFFDECLSKFPLPKPKTKGLNRDSKLSFRSLENTGERAYLVVEFDFVEEDENGNDTAAAPMLRRLAAEGVTIADLCAAILAELAKSRPLALVVHSAGKSLHGWYPCTGAEEEVMHRFMRFAVSLGADNATWSRCQWVRMPGGLRNKAKRQRVLYFDPAVIGGAK